MLGDYGFSSFLPHPHLPQVHRLLLLTSELFKQHILLHNSHLCLCVSSIMALLTFLLAWVELMTNILELILQWDTSPWENISVWTAYSWYYGNLWILWMRIMIILLNENKYIILVQIIAVMLQFVSLSGRNGLYDIMKVSRHWFRW